MDQGAASPTGETRDTDEPAAIGRFDQDRGDVLCVGKRSIKDDGERLKISGKVARLGGGVVPERALTPNIGTAATGRTRWAARSAGLAAI